MSKKKYDPLPQFSESDSDIDIFNAKGSPQRPVVHKRKADFSNKKCYIGIALLVVTVILVAAAVAFRNINKKHGYVVKTKVGSIKGSKELFGGRTAYKFRGIPYAEPPVGELRWQPPVPKKKQLSGEYVDDKPNVCIQYHGLPLNSMGKEDEDCLYLHIHTPTLDSNSNLPVFVWLHGGYSMNGYGYQPGYYPDGEFVLAMDVVGVSVDFRLNAFGYLTLKELWKKNQSHGNYGLLDQILALQWVKDNIKGFGGNPDLVTIAGQSSGGTSIYALLASPSADGLFKRAIPMSGSPYFPRNYSVTASDNRVFVEKSKCQNQIGDELKSCMYKLSPEEVLEAIPDSVYPFWAMDELTDFPTYGHLDGSVFVVDPVSMPVAPKDVYLLKSMRSKVDLLIGTTAQEPDISPNYYFDTGDKLVDFLTERLKPFKSISTSNVINAYTNFSRYINGNVSAQYLYETIVTDVRVSCPTNKFVKDLRRSRMLKNTFRYVSAWKPEKMVTLYDKVNISYAAHATDSFALFGFKGWEVNGVLGDNERAFVTSIREVFGRFMRKGDVLGAKPGETIVFDGKGKVESIKGDYHQEQCSKLWDVPSNGFLSYTWIN